MIRKHKKKEKQLTGERGGAVEPLKIQGIGPGEFLNNPYCPMCAKRIDISNKRISVRIYRGPYLDFCYQCFKRKQKSLVR